ncbi:MULTISPECIES: hypothetical protein [unclassified Methanosarcina]|uniref:hypothetical protein n=1 Tax=unclassified Methanosarcina TaxID=2644672 RepID=UPI000615B0E2|nr:MULTISPECIES: hypothetical protein [unclassified Methanosarcina]AKB19212.1 hypothetical protein MSWHS_2349 [Methanosarcina sp. WWM596]AKB22956.1 hypothetical protein MSWH1_2685 [Methanosarcina sp. WH1]
MIANRKFGIGALLAAILIASMAFVPAVNAQADINASEKLDSIKINSVVDEKDRKEYYATVPHENGTQQKLYVKQWQDEVDGKQVWKFDVYEVNADGTLSTVSFGKDSYYWTDSSGIHFHFGPRDNVLLRDGSMVIIDGIAAIIAIFQPEAAGVLAAFAIAMDGVIIAVEWEESNPDGSLDVFISWTNLAKIALPGVQNISVKIGSHYYTVVF